MMREFTFGNRPRNRRLPLLILALGCTTLLIALDKCMQTENRLDMARQQAAAISREAPVQVRLPSEADVKKSALARTIQEAVMVDWNHRLGQLESLRGEAVWVDLLRITALDTMVELRVMSATLEAANGALDRYARAAGEEQRPIVRSITYRDGRYVTTATLTIR